MSGPEPVGDVLTAPALIWIEILSQEDRPIRVNRKVRDLTDGILRIPDSPIEVPLQALEEDGGAGYLPGSAFTNCRAAEFIQ